MLKQEDPETTRRS